MQPDSTLSYALLYSRLGLRVHPLVSQSKRPLLDNWPALATGDEATIRRWWDEWPDANVGIVGGAESGVLILDFDVKPEKGIDGLQTWHDWLDSYQLDLPRTPVARSPSGGQHWYFKHHVAIKTGTSVIYEGWDVRAENGYVVTPASVLPNGAYEWLVSPEECDFAELPAQFFMAYAQAKQSERSGRQFNTTFHLGEQETRMTQLAGALLRQGATFETIEAALLDAAEHQCDPPMLAKDARRIAESIGQRPTEDPFEVLPQHDIGYAQRFAYHVRDKLRFVLEDGDKGWAFYDGRRWRRKDYVAAQQMYEAFTYAFDAYVQSLPVPEDQNDPEYIEKAVFKDEMTKFARKGFTSRMMESTLKLAKSSLRASLDEFDRQPHLFNCKNGTLNLETMELQLHRASDLITRWSPIAYNPVAISKGWSLMLDLVTNRNEELKEYLQRAAGFTMFGGSQEQVLFVLYGVTGTGKSSFIGTIEHIFGSYAEVLPNGALNRKNQSGGPNPSLAKAYAARLLTSVELSADDKLDTPLIKSITGNESISTRGLYESDITYKPQFTVWFATNGLPTVDADEALFRRVKVIPFEHRIWGTDELDKSFIDRLKESNTDMEGVLAWAVQGFSKWRVDGLKEPENVQAATREYAEDMNPVATFVTEIMELGDDYSISIPQAWGLYKEWATNRGVDSGKDGRKLTHGLKEIGISKFRVGPKGEQVWHYRGIRLRENSLRNRTVATSGPLDHFTDN